MDEKKTMPGSPAAPRGSPKAPVAQPPVAAGELRWNDAGLVPAIVQDAATGEVLMLAWQSRESLERTIATGRATFFSRSRGAKGWWGYLLTVPIILYLAISAAAGHPVGGHAR